MRFLRLVLIAVLAFGLPRHAMALDDLALRSLSDSERAYYNLVFDYVMETIKADGKYEWASYSAKGTLTVSEAYISKSGSTCRNFAEVFTVHGLQGENEGIGCKRRGYQGWCKLGINDAGTCSMERNKGTADNLVDSVTDAIGSVGSSISSGGSGGGIGGVGAGSMGDVTTEGVSEVMQGVTEAGIEAVDKVGGGGVDVSGASRSVGKAASSAGKEASRPGVIPDAVNTVGGAVR
jgi:hypothetical protein